MKKHHPRKSRVEIARTIHTRHSSILSSWTATSRYSLASDGRVYHSWVMCDPQGTKYKYPWRLDRLGVTLEDFISDYSCDGDKLIKRHEKGKKVRYDE